MNRTIILLFTSLLFFWGSLGLQAQEPDCSAPQELDKYHLLRRLSLDLRHQMPSYEEYLALDAEDGVPEAWIDSWLIGDEYKTMARRFHESLLWTNLNKVAITTAQNVISSTGQGPARRYHFFGAGRKNTFRGGSAVCVDEPQVEYLEGETTTGDGTVIPWRIPKPIEEEVDPGSGKTIVREGYVMVTPYWAPGTQIKVCAFDAQDADLVPSLRRAQNGDLVPILTSGGPAYGHCSDGYTIATQLSCGAGPNLRWGMGPGVTEKIWADLREQVFRLIDDFTAGGEPYSQLLTTDRIYWNGTLAFWNRHLIDMTNLSKTFNMVQKGDAELPEEPDYTDNEVWTAYERNVVDGVPTDMGHSGILTHPGYTLRFQTNRARANRFRTVFTKQYFIPPDDPEDENSGECDPLADDLTQRCTCRYCHQVLEPMAAYFGKVIEAGSSLLSDPDAFPIYEPECDHTGDVCCQIGGNRKEYRSPEECPPVNVVDITECEDLLCSRFYVSDPQQQNPGVLLPHQYAYVPDGQDPATILDALHLEISLNLDEGVRGLAQKVIDGGQFHSAMVQNIFAYLMGREMILNPAQPNNEIALLTTLAGEFKNHDDFRAMVKRIVLLEQYRRVQ